MSELGDAIERLELWARGEEFDELTAVIAAARERDALAAVIEEARAIPHGRFGPWDDDVCDYEQLAAILSRTPSDALAAHDREVAAKALLEAADAAFDRKVMPGLAGYARIAVANWLTRRAELVGRSAGTAEGNRR